MWLLDRVIQAIMWLLHIDLRCSVYYRLIHAVDWYPTLLAAAGIQTKGKCIKPVEVR